MNPIALIILDGFGFREKTDANAIALAKTPHLDRFLKDYPHTLLDACGEAVGLPPGTMGNSEVGHLTIGAGRINYQDLSKINRAIQDGSFFKNPVLEKAFQLAAQNKKTVHLLGLLSDAGVHSHTNHLFALLKMAREHAVPHVAVHCFLDGRDTPPKSSRKYVQALQKELGSSEQIATLVGRFYAMDRDKRWERVQVAYEALVEAKGMPATDPLKAIEEAYAKNLADEFITPFVFGDPKLNRIHDGDVVIFFNFRPDRAREITQSLTDPDFNGFQRQKFLRVGMYVCMTEYDKKIPFPIAYPPERPKRVLAELLSERGIPQFHTAETEKYAHVTYFLNGGVEPPFPGEERLLVPSPRDVPTYDKKPEMSAVAVTEGALKKIQDGCPVIFMNYANPDMVGHSGDLEASIRAVEVIDDCIGQITNAIFARGGTVLITADHGNCEEMKDEHGGPHTAHTLNPVPFLLIGDQWKNTKLRPHGGLQDVAPTFLKILDLPKPPEMTGESLILKS